MPQHGAGQQLLQNRRGVQQGEALPGRLQKVDTYSATDAVYVLRMGCYLITWSIAQFAAFE